MYRKYRMLFLHIIQLEFLRQYMLCRWVEIFASYTCGTLEERLGNLMSKFDPALGKEISQHLLSHGVETPFFGKTWDARNLDKVENIRKHFEAIMTELNLDLTDDSLKDSPLRVAKMYVQEI